MTRIMIFGISGMIGRALNQTLTSDGYDVYGTYYQHQPINIPANRIIPLPLEKANLLNEFLTRVKPDFVIMALRGDFDKQLKFHVQAAEYLKENGGQLVFCSTANVFDAITDSHHYEDDVPKALSEYGQFKIECERILTELLRDQLTIVRIPTILGHDTPRMNKLLLNLKDGKSIKLYTNLHSTRNSDYMLSKQIEYLIEETRSGIFHLATKDIMVHSEFITALVSQLGFANFNYQELKIETFSSLIPDRYDNSLLTKYTFPLIVQITHKQLIAFLAKRQKAE